MFVHRMVFLVSACMLAGCSTTTSTSSTPTTDGTSTAGVLCSYSNNTYNSNASVLNNSIAQWSCDTTTRTVTGNGIPDHDVGAFPNTGNPNAISAQTVKASGTISPVNTGKVTSVKVSGYALNSVKFDPGTGGSCSNDGVCTALGNAGPWRLEALGGYDFGTDSNNAHVQPGGAYHYHGMPEGLLSKLSKGEKAMTLVGWASDGFPVYARYGYNTASDASSGVKVLTGSYKLKTTPDAGRPSTSTYPMKTFQQDWEYVAGSGDLDECNGRTGVTPEFPKGTYYYAITDTYPYIQRCVKGTPGSSSEETPPPPPSGTQRNGNNPPPVGAPPK